MTRTCSKCAKEIYNNEFCKDCFLKDNAHVLREEYFKDKYEAVI